MTRAIEIVEVSPRDGLQNEAKLISTADKVALIERAIAFGARRIEVVSFVNPSKVQQMADAEAVVAALPVRDDVTYIGLVLNQRGAERALATAVDELGAVCVATDTFAMRNQGQSSNESLLIANDIVRIAKAEGRSAQITIAAAFGCPFEGRVSPERVVAMAQQAAEAGPREIALADTIGAAVPSQVDQLVRQVRAAVGTIPVRVHCHNTRGTGIANVWAAIEAGASIIDSALGGLGGCPFAPGAAGNVATEDVIYMLDQSGISTCYEFDGLITANAWLAGIMGKTLPAMAARAPMFPTAEVAAR